MFQKNPRKALLLGIATILMWSSMSTASEISLEGLEPIQLMPLGFSFSALILGVYLLISGEWKEARNIRKKDWLNVFGQGSSLFAYYFFLFSSYALLPAQITQPVNATWAFVLVFANAWLLKEKLGKNEIAGMFLAYIGVVVIALGGAKSEELSHSINFEGVFYAVISTVFMAAYWIINNRCELSHRVSLFLGFVFAALWSTGALIILNPSWENATLISIGATLYLAFFEWTIPFTTWTLALKLTNSIPTISALSFFTPFLSLFWISLVLAEPIVITTFIGLFFIVGGTIVLQKFKKKSA